MEECFVCLRADGITFKICHCPGAVHAECFEQLRRVPSHATHCAVCKYNYARLRETTRCAVSDAQRALWISYILYGSLTCFYVFMYTYDSRVIPLLLGMQAVCTVLLLVLHRRVCVATRRCCCCGVEYVIRFRSDDA